MPLSSPTAKVVASCGPSLAGPRSSSPAPAARASVMAKMSTVSWRAWRKSTTALSCSGSRLAIGSAVLAAAKRWERIIPSLAPASSEATFGMWQSMQFFASGG